MRYASIRELDISNGEGVGVALFVQGCPFNPHCPNCFNPETWDFNGGKEWTQDSEDKLLELANKPYIKRLSILGGEPLADENLDGVLHLVDRFRLSFPNKSIWIYSGYTWNQLIEEYNQYKYTPFAANTDEWLTRWEIISNVDVLVDGEYIDEQRDVTLKWRGSKNQRVIDVKESIAQNKIVLYCD